MSTPPTGFWRRLRWYYDGKPDLSRNDHLYLRHVGMGLDIPWPGERARIQRHMDEAREMMRIAHGLRPDRADELDPT